MANNEFKKIGKHDADTKQGESFVDVMKPFVKFGIGAMSVIASTLIYIVKNVPKPNQKAIKNPDRKVIKVK